MKVILREDIEKVGRLGEVVEVRAGYARNFLVPRQKAYLLTPDAEKQIEAEKRRRLMREQKRIEELKEMATLLNGRSVTITARAQEEKLYGSVGPDEIAAAIMKEHKVNVPPTAIAVEEPFKTLGTPDVTIKLAPNAEAVIKVWIVAET
jgi:large subunit ribosomal protein L9